MGDRPFKTGWKQGGRARRVATIDLLLDARYQASLPQHEPVTTESVEASLRDALGFSIKTRVTGKSPEPAGWKTSATRIGPAMNESVPSRPIVRFGLFELDLTSEELRKNGLKIRLSGQPFQILSMLLERPGEVVTREQLQQKLWPGGTFVDFDHSLNAAINIRLRIHVSSRRWLAGVIDSSRRWMEWEPTSQPT